MGVLNPGDIEINANDIIQTLSAQRNAAMDEIAKQGAIIRTLQKRIDELEHPPQSAEKVVNPA